MTKLRAVICQKQISVEGDGHCCHRPSSNWETNRRSYFTEHGRQSGVIIYPSRLCNISGHRSARNTNEESISIISRSGNRSLVVAIACKYKFPRWQPKWRQNRYLYVSGHRSATKTNKESISIIPRSANRSPVLAIALKCNFPRWRPKWPPKQIFVCRSS